MKKVVAFVDDEVDMHDIVKILLKEHIKANDYELQTFESAIKLLEFANIKRISYKFLPYKSNSEF